jgi:hypothetical protein
MNKNKCGYPILRDPDNIVRNNCVKLRCGFKLPGLPVYVFVARNAALDPRLFPPECFPWDFLQDENGVVVIEDATGLPLLLEC